MDVLSLLFPFAALTLIALFSFMFWQKKKVSDNDVLADEKVWEVVGVTTRLPFEHELYEVELRAFVHDGMAYNRVLKLKNPPGDWLEMLIPGSLVTFELQRYLYFREDPRALKLWQCYSLSAPVFTLRTDTGDQGYTTILLHKGSLVAMGSGSALQQSVVDMERKITWNLAQLRRSPYLEQVQQPSSEGFFARIRLLNALKRYHA